MLNMMTVYKPAKSRDYYQQSEQNLQQITTNPEARETLTCLAGLIKKIKT